jgi:hypothetical protein
MAYWEQLRRKGEDVEVKEEPNTLPDELRMSSREWCESWHTVPLPLPQVPARWISMDEKSFNKGYKGF